MDSRRIAVVEDEPSIASSVAARLRTEGFEVRVAGDGLAGVELCRTFRPDLVVLDLMLPGIDGLEVCRRIQRERSVPVLMLTARDSETDLEIGLAIGADDYMTKPFSPRELVARIRAILRRVERTPESDADAIRLGSLEIDAATRRVTSRGRDVHLTPTEFDLLHRLAQTPHVVFGRRRLLEEVWGYRFGHGERTVDSHVRSIRRKLGSRRDPNRARNRLRPGHERPVRPLDFISSIKVKLGVVIVAAVLLTVAVMLLGERSGLSAALTATAAVVLALGLVQVLAHGMTRPLREMVGAARAMSRGEYGRRVTATSRDEVGELARAFNRMAADLAEVDRVRRDLIANVSHELRTPIGSLRALLENLVDGVEEPDSRAFETMSAQIERLGALVEQLLDLSRLESGAVPLDRSPLSAAALVEAVAADWRPTAGARGIQLQLVVEPHDLVLDADRVRLHQVLGNLVANAVRHAPTGSAITIGARKTANGTALEVLDDGPGIPRVEAERVFERFYRSDHARSSGDGGSGLGLAIARWIVELHDGSIRMEERTPTGCRMVVELPA